MAESVSSEDDGFEPSQRCESYCLSADVSESESSSSFSLLRFDPTSPSISSSPHLPVPPPFLIAGRDVVLSEPKLPKSDSDLSGGNNPGAK